jgi:hypothetical protein
MNQELTQNLYKSFVTPKFIPPTDGMSRRGYRPTTKAGWGSIWRKITGVRNLGDVKFLFRAAGKVLGHLTDFSPKESRAANQQVSRTANQLVSKNNLSKR